jgi:ATP-dependent protease ClpP protease subunit
VVVSRLKLFGFCCVALLIAAWQFGATDRIGPSTQTLTAREEPNRVVLAWSGPISEPMRDRIVTAIDKYKADKRHLVIALNSPGGSIAHGREVMAAIRKASHLRPIDTLVEQGGVCASMCVPIYLIGKTRTADPGAHFMFHEASLELPEGKEISKMDRETISPIRKTIGSLATDDLFLRDIGTQRVDARWLKNMRTKIAQREIWLTGLQLVQEGSGVVDVLVPKTAK